ncbi:Ni-sirohydrochlorin a,c-diamide reductive cyclase ATP-dependent reductase subunit [Methanobrevibacter oralis]|uniref:Nitrogenase iron protein 1 n=1 Tax=Methanobrevibacter oralis TaxID=66851 RepID=A0A166C2I5_METOA|nr:Ni-sirohydrochlorin a,c-diamide reductive cyclase ATP-dependent reductase subunit [Methanobrevibacter oralis]KZX14062.1 nitrogenase iron protein 1 [Methanobrevibacter oralis]
MIKKIAFYGKGGIGKSTTVANLSAVWACDDLNCLVIGCDPKADTTRTLYGSRIPTVVSTIKNNKNPTREDLVYKGYRDILCVESGGPEPGVGCAGRGVIVAMKRLEKVGIFDEDLDVVVYDVLGDVVCGGFSVPLREKYADEVIIVTSGEYMALYAANNIVRGIKKLKGNLSGIVCNCRNVDNEEKIVNEFARKIGTDVLSTIHRSNLIQQSELDAKTVVEKYPESDEAHEYRTLASNIMNKNSYTTPEPMDDVEFEEFFKSFL